MYVKIDFILSNCSCKDEQKKNYQIPHKQKTKGMEKKKLKRVRKKHQQTPILTHKLHVC